jgi:putative restriction endonuclease
LPFWHLQGDALWHVDGGNKLPRQAGGFPRMGGLRETSGALDAAFVRALRSDRSFLLEVIGILLEDHFPESVHDDILAAVGLRLPASEMVADAPEVERTVRRRDPDFRRRVLRAYEHQCAVTSSRLALGGQYFGLEAAHVRWHAYGGPDRVDNGFAAEPMIHKLFDAGAWTLTDDRRILVSAELTGSGHALAEIRKFHGHPLAAPLPGEPAVSAEYIRWHRDPDLGGVFREPALDL